MKRIYVASSWRCEHQPAVIAALKREGYDVYDFRHPEPGNEGFHWSAIDPTWKGWQPEAFREALNHPVAQNGFLLDMDALVTADATILVMPCGRSAHLELGYAAGAGQITGVLLNGECEPELMYKMADFIALDIEEVLSKLHDLFRARP